MRKERTRPMTKELAMQLRIWMNLMYRKHFVTDTKGQRKEVKPKANPDDLVLAFWHEELVPTPAGIYKGLHREYVETANLLEMKFKGERRVITFHSLRGSSNR